jgi:hypothetical protein
MTADQPQPVAAALVLDEVIAVRPASRCSARSGKP